MTAGRHEAKGRPCARRRFARRFVVAVAGGLLAASSSACAISPQPVPPPGEETQITIQAGLVSVQDDGSGGVMLHGDPGAVVPGADVLRALNRSMPTPVMEVQVRADGSFDVPLRGAATDAFRAQARKGVSYSEPVDLQGTGGGPVAVLEPPFGSCAMVEPAREVVFPPTPSNEISMQPVRVVNTCPFDLSVASFASLEGNGAFETMTGTVSTAYVPMGSEALLGIAFHPTQPGLYEDQVSIEFLAQPPDPSPDPALLPNWLLSIRGMAPSE